MRSLWPLFALLAGCQCGPLGVDTTRFVCATTADCLSGFECRDVGDGLECVRLGTELPDAGPRDAGTADAGFDAGTEDAGDVDAGGVDAGDDAGVADAGPTDAGLADAGVPDAGLPDAGLPDAGLPDAGTPASVLVITTAPQTVATSTCTQVLVVETRNALNQATPVFADTVVSLSAAPAGNVNFYAASGCVGPVVTSVTVAAGFSSANFYALGATGGSYTVRTAATGFSQGTQTLVLQSPPNSLVFTSTPPVSVRGGTCLTATVEARRSGVATPVAGTTTVGLTVVPAGGARFYSNAACTLTATSTQMAAASSSATFFVKPLTGGSVVISAAAPFGTAMQSLNTVPIVRRGQCTFAARQGLSDGGTTTETTATCSVSPPLTDLTASMLFTQSTGVISGAETGSAQVRCRLSSTSLVSCLRRQDEDAASVHFQVAEIPAGMLVQRATSFGCPASTTLPTQVTPSKTFLLKSSATSSTNFDDDDAPVAELAGAPDGGVWVSWTSGQCEGFDLQVVQWEGLSVARGTVTGGLPDGGSSLTVAGLPAAGTNRAVLLQPGTSVNAPRPVCSTMVRAATAPSSVVLTRGAGAPTCPLAPLDLLHYERIDFGSKAVVYEYTTVFAPGVPSRAVTVTPVDVTRTVVFASSQISGGQGGGETDEGGPSHFVEGAFQLVLTNGTTVTATRAESNSTASLTFFVAELLP